MNTLGPKRRILRRLPLDSDNREVFRIDPNPAWHLRLSVLSVHVRWHDDRSAAQLRDARLSLSGLHTGIRGSDELSSPNGMKAAYHGLSTLSPWPLFERESHPFSRQSKFWLPRPYIPRTEIFQRRLGGKIALVCEVAIGSRRTGSLERPSGKPQGTDELRIEQLKETLADAQRYKDIVPSVIGGDFNLVASEGMAAEVLAEAGFHDAVGSRSPTTRGARPRRIDGLFVRGSETVEGGAVHTSAGLDPIIFPVSTRIRSVLVRLPILEQMRWFEAERGREC